MGWANESPSCAGSPTSKGDRLEVENQVRPGNGSPMHAHNFQEEVVTVTRGDRLSAAGGGERFAGVGETVSFPAGVAHRFWNAGEEDLVCTGYIEPADNTSIFCQRSSTGRAISYQLSAISSKRGDGR